jgi:hypothetical protein
MADTTPTDKIRFASDVVIDKITMQSYSGNSVDITALVETFDIYESLFDGYMSSTLLITDAIGLAEKFPIIGMESVTIRYRSSIREKMRNLTFRVYKISDRTLQENDRVQSYVLHMITPEVIQSSMIKVSRAYTGYHHEIAVKVFQEYFQIENEDQVLNDIITLEPSAESDRILFPNWNPLKCMQMVCHRAKRKSNPEDMTYVFYQTMDGFHFNTLSTLSQAPAKRNLVRRIANQVDPQTKNRDILSTISVAEDISIKSSFDRLSDLRHGKFAAQVYGYDPFRRIVKAQDYRYDVDFGKTEHLEEFPDIPTKNQSLTKNVGSNIRWVSVSPDRDSEISPEAEFEVSSKRNAQISRYSDNQMVLVINGDSDLHCGDVIDITVPSMSYRNESQTPKDNQLSGRYMVHVVRHSVLRNNEYKCYLTIGRDSIPNRIADFKEPISFEGSSNPDRNITQRT